MNKRLYRTEIDRKLAGVCGGIAEYFKFDPSFIRIGFALTVFLGGFGLILYILMWLIVPTKSKVV